MSLTRDNTKNNNTYARYLYKIIGYIYNKYLNLILIYNKLIRFKKKASKINYLAHINNLIIKAILKFLGSSTYKDTIVFLN
jgi:hypothetical protein